MQWEDAPGAPPLGAFLTEQARDKRALGLLRSIGFPGFEGLGLQGFSGFVGVLGF